MNKEKSKEDIKEKEENKEASENTEVKENAETHTEEKTLETKAEEIKGTGEPKAPVQVVLGNPQPPDEESAAKQSKVSGKDYTLEVIEDHDANIDLFFIENKDPNYEYRFLREERKNLSEKTSNMLHFKGGWQIVGSEHLLQVLKFTSEDLSADGLLRRGDLVLAFMPKHLYEKKMIEKEKQASMKTDAVQRIIDGGDKSVAGVGHESIRGLETDKQLGLK